MRLEPKLDLIGAALGDASRSKMLCALMDGRAHTGKELAAAVGISPQTASAHLQRLVGLALITAERSGRCVYYALASEAVADMLEQVAVFTPLDHLDRAKRCHVSIRGFLWRAAVTGILAGVWRFCWPNG